MTERVQRSASSWVEAIVGLLSVAGLADSLLLTFEHYKALTLPCSFTNGCETVLSSQWSQVGPIPLSLLGVGFYGVLLFAVIYALSNKTSLPRRPLLAWSTIGLMSSAWLVFVQGVIIKAWCQYCLLSALSATLIFVTAFVAYRSDRHDLSANAGPAPSDNNNQETDDDEKEA